VAFDHSFLKGGAMTTQRIWIRTVLLLICGAILGAVIDREFLAVTRPSGTQTETQQQPAQQAQSGEELPSMESLPKEVARLMALSPSNSHYMMDVQWHWTNLWFAGQARNWPLAQYYFNESRNHILWFVKKAPTLRSAGPEREEVNIKDIFEAIDTSALTDLKNAIAMKDSALFASTYRTMLESCYSCHKSAGRPYLRPQIPTAQMQSILNYDPNATWPQ
jgi:hypothetical protein